ncbi:tetratricopeptide repeat protein [bacterium]|nr:tetratricopeptide repeat protein [bacterium]
MTGLNKLTLIALSAILYSGCKTSGDLRHRSNNEEPEEIKTVTNPVIQPTSGASPDLERELAVTKGRLAEVETLRQREKQAYLEQIAQLEGEREKLIAAVTELKGKPSTTPAPTTTSGKDGFKILWDEAFAQIKTKKYSSAASLFEEITKRYPSRSGTYYAYIGMAFSLYSSGKYKEAALGFNDALDKYSKHRNRSIATFGLGVSFSKLNKAKNAKIFYEEVKTVAPKSAHGQLATALLAGKAKIPQDLFIALPKWYQ